MVSVVGGDQFIFSRVVDLAIVEVPDWFLVRGRRFAIELNLNGESDEIDRFRTDHSRE